MWERKCIFLHKGVRKSIVFGISTCRQEYSKKQVGGFVVKVGGKINSKK